MKIRRIASSIALAAAVALGATGCGLFAPQATTDPYSPSDGIDVTVAGVDVRNLMLIADEEAENFNVVFTGVNTGDETVQLRISFVDANGTSTATADFEVKPGSTPFGAVDGEFPPVLVSIPDLAPGAMVTAFLQVPGGADVERQVPVLDGTLAEYRPYVLSVKDILAVETEDAVETETGESTN